MVPPLLGEGEAKGGGSPFCGGAGMLKRKGMAWYDFRMKFAIACGGTGGHTFPGLATAGVLRGRGHSVVVIGAGRSVESATFKGWDGDVFFSGAVKSPLRHPFATFRAVVKCMRFMKAERPDAVLAMGSYASLPPVLVAWFLRIPVVLHEANAVPGKANVFLSRFARAIAITFSESARYFKSKTSLTGLPIRSELVGQPAMLEADDSKFTVLVTGGSQGAHAVNDVASSAIALLAAKMPSLRVIHQTGVADEQEVRSRYEAAGVDASVSAFIKQMGGAFKSADFAIARSGAATCCELAAFGLPAFFIPLPRAVRDHQFLNARHLADKGAAFVMRQAECTPGKLADVIADVACNRAKLAEMGEKMRSMAAPSATAALADLVEATGRRA